MAPMTAPQLSPSPLALDPEEFRRLGYQAVDMAAAHLAGIRERLVFRPMTPQQRAALLELPLPDAGTPPEAILRQIEASILPHPMGNGHPRFFGWVNSPPAPLAVLAELLAAALDPSCAGGDHAAIYLERAALRRLMEMVGFPTEGSMGLLVSGGSMATLTALAAARQRAARDDGWDVRAEGLSGRPQLVLYTSEEGHGCIRKSAELLGIGGAGVRTVPVDGDFRMDVGALRRAIAADRAAGLRPFCVAASAGTVNTGAIDPLDALADLCAAERLWLHVDGAYGAVGVLDPAMAPRYAGIERADSLALDPHKWLSVPVECGCVFVRDGALLRDTFSLVPPYLRTEEGKGFGGLPWFSEYGFQQSRGFRALKLWAVLQHAGRDGLAAHVARHNALARSLAALVEGAPDLERLAPVELSIVCFRYVPESLRGDEERLDAHNKALMEAIQSEGEAFLSSTVLNGRFALRACILHYGTTDEDIAALVEVVRRTGARLIAAGS
jgi:glutamate/tyrosine decarboxylase-like PLP-dependent enzyme